MLRFVAVVVAVGAAFVLEVVFVLVFVFLVAANSCSSAKVLSHSSICELRTLLALFALCPLC